MTLLAGQASSYLVNGNSCSNDNDALLDASARLYIALGNLDSSLGRFYCVSSIALPAFFGFHSSSSPSDNNYRLFQLAAVILYVRK